MSVLSQLKMYSRFVWGLGGFLREPVTLQYSENMIRQRLQNRSENLLRLVKHTIYENPASPYLPLLDLAGCKYGDLVSSVHSHGLETALKKLAAEGVYFNTDEFKGKKPVKRGGKAIMLKEDDFNNPFYSGQLEARSGASRSPGTRTAYEYRYLRDNRSIYNIQMLTAYGLADLPFALWSAIMPGGGPMFLLSYTKAGKIPARWFSPVNKESFRPSLQNRLGTNFIVYSGRFFGKKLPFPEYVAADDALRVTTWMSGMVKQYGGCCLHTYTSLAVRICQIARQSGLDLTGAVFFVGGEPVTEAKWNEIARVGAVACSVYGFVEAGFIGAGCRNPVTPGEVHLFQDSFALVQHSREVPHAAISIDAFLFSTLLPSAPKILLNVESGDWGTADSRSCGCAFEKLGLTCHLHNIRGFDKLTGEGMTFIGTDLMRIIEEVLPEKFGGSSGDYQMIEDEDERGLTRMSIIASPELGEIDESSLTAVIINELKKGSDTQRMMAEVWSESGTLQVKRIQPFTTAAGKLIPLHVNKRKMAP
jgi:hypothetical protein